MFEVISHHFAGGVYCKLMRIKENSQVVSHKHEYDHMSVLMQGCVIVRADGEQNTYYAPNIIEIKAGVEHSIVAINGDAVWGCIHATDCTDESKIDDLLIKQPHMCKTAFLFDVNSAMKELERHPELWNQHTMRTESPTSPHREVSDIWLRYKDPRLPVDQSQPHQSVWYPALEKLPSIQRIIETIMMTKPGDELGGVLITKIPAGKQVYPHGDAGAWHSEYYNEKILVLLQSAPGQSFNYADETHEGLAGEVFTFDNLPEHWVINNSDIDRISLILAVRSEPHAST